MKLIKSLVAIAVTAFVGASALAVEEQLKLQVDQGSQEYSFSYEDGARWYKLQRLSGDDCVSAEITSGETADRCTEAVRLSDEKETTVTFKFTGKAVGTATWKLFRCNNPTGTPATQPPSTGDTPFSGSSNFWAPRDSGDATERIYVITVVAPPSVSVVPQCDEDHTTAKVYTNGVEVTGDPIKVVTNATVDVVFAAAKGWIFEDFSTVKTNTVTATDDPTVVAGDPVFAGDPVGENVYVFTKDGVGTIFGEGIATNLPSGFNLDSITNVVVADGITEINARFFKKCRKLNTVKLGKNVTKVGENAFYLCRALEKIEILNPEFDTSCLENAIVYQTAIDPDGKLYTIPSITIPGYKEVLYGTNDLEGSWEEIPLGTTMEESQYHFFKHVLEKIVLEKIVD